MLVLLAARFGLPDQRVDPAVEWLLGQQLADGGWNCESVRSGSTHGSFHTSITVLEALLAYEHAGGSVPVAAAMAEGPRLVGYSLSGAGMMRSGHVRWWAA